MKTNIPDRYAPAPDNFGDHTPLEATVRPAAPWNRAYKVAGAVLFFAALFCCCTLPLDPSKNPDNVAVSTSLCRDGDCTGDTLDSFINDTVSLSLSCKYPHLIDSLSMTILPEVSGQAVVVYRAGYSPDDTLFLLRYDHPCTLQVVTEALLCNASRRIDTAIVVFREVPGSNTAPALTIHPKRTYATPALPCSVAIAAADGQAWQTIEAGLVSMPDSARMIGDSLFIWTPVLSDTGSVDTLIFIACDNSSEVMADTDTVVIAVIPDDAPPATPQGFEIVQRRLKNVTFRWNRVISADYYRIYRNCSPKTDGWELIDSTADTVYTDETDSAFYYQITAVNLFYRSKPSVFISGADTLFHGLFFPDSGVGVAETDSIVTISLRLTEPLPETLIVAYEVYARGTTADTLDFSFVDSVHSLLFAPGDTVKDIRVRMFDDTVPEYGEMIALRLFGQSVVVAVRDSIYRCEIAPDRDSLRQVLRVSMVKIVCEMADDEGLENIIDISALDVALSIVERTADSTAQRVNPAIYIHQYNGGEIGMVTSTTLDPWAAKPALVVLDADRFDPSMAIITFGGYAVDVDPTGNDIGGGSLILSGANFVGPHSFTIVSATNFVIRVEFVVEAAE